MFSEDLIQANIKTLRCEVTEIDLEILDQEIQKKVREFATKNPRIKVLSLTISAGSGEDRCGRSFLSACAVVVYRDLKEGEKS